jgi:hypothetical protein
MASTVRPRPSPWKGPGVYALAPMSNRSSTR